MNKQAPQIEDFERWGADLARTAVDGCTNLSLGPAAKGRPGSGDLLKRARRSSLNTADKIAAETAAAYSAENGQLAGDAYLRGYRTTLRRLLRERNIKVAPIGLNGEV